MSRKFLKILYFVMILFFLISCTKTQKSVTKGNNWYDLGEAVSVSGIMNVPFSKYQLDSMCNVDNLPTDFGKWSLIQSRDYESGKVVSKYLFIKDMSKELETIYTVINNDTVFVVSKRIKQ